MTRFSRTRTASSAHRPAEASARTAFKLRAMNAAHHRALAALSAVLALSLGVASHTNAANIKCPPDVFVMNKKATAIKVLRFEYTVLDKSYIESLVNKRLAPGQTEEWPTQQLGHAAEGNVIATTRVEYKDDNSGGGDGWGSAHWSDYHSHSTTYLCFKGTNYWLGVD
jgi:hypothetical protein